MFTSRISFIALLAALGTGLPALAQETAPAEAPVEAPAEAPAAAAPGADLSMGANPAAAAGEPQVGANYPAATFEAWEQRCMKTGLEADPCQLYTLLKDAQGNSVAELSIFNLPAGSQGPAVAGATFIAPLETLLTANLQLVVDTGEPRSYPFSVCTPVGCIARLGFTAEEVTGLKRGGKASFTIVPFVAPDQPVTIDASLKGFTAGYDAVVAANVLADAAAAAGAAAQGAADAPAAPAAP